MATSPPTPTNLTLPNPKKRPSAGPPPHSVTTPGFSSQATKRLKQEHPLRQTSFPASEVQAGVYTPTGPRSETGSVSASLISGFSGTTGGKRSRGRPKKRKWQTDDTPNGRGIGGLEYEDADENENNHQEASSSILSGLNDNNGPYHGRRNRGDGTKSVMSGGGGPSGGAAAEEDDDDANAPLADPDSDESRRLHAELAKEKEHIAQLQEALTPDQMQRYTSYLRTKLKGTTLKRIVNQTVSQSVTANPLQAVQWVGKVFVGEIVELARVVQGEWAVAWEAAKLGREEGERRRRRTGEKGDEPEGGESPKSTTAPTTAPLVEPTQDLYDGANPHRGGLLPDHLREAVRRYKADGEGGGTGFGGYSFSNLGVKGEAVPRLGMGSGGGRRLFR